MSKNFMKGYERSVKVRQRLTAAIDVALIAHPEQRLGQIIYNALEVRTNKETDGMYDPMLFRTNFHNKLFYIYDEELIEALMHYDDAL